MRTQWVNLLLLAFAVAYTYFARNLNPGTITDPGPGFFPRILGIGMIVTMLVIPGVELWNRVRRSAEAKAIPLIPGRNALLFTAGLLGYMLALPIAGYPVSTFLALMYLVRLMGERRWVVTLALAVLLTTSFYLVFRKLEVPLPMGMFG